MTTQWTDFFNSHAPHYMENSFTSNTLDEVDFVIDELHLRPGMSILDIGCGTGRHSIELARRGFVMTGVDISGGMLKQAQDAAHNAGVAISLICSDAANFKASQAFDASICLCEGAFCLLGNNDDYLERDQIILNNISQALKPGGGFILTALNAFRMARLYSDKDVIDGRYDPLKLIETSNMEIESESGKSNIKVRERGYTAPELARMFGAAGLQVLNIFGGTAGNWGRRQLLLDEYEIMVISKKQ